MAILDLTKHSGTTIIKIPDFDSIETVEIEVRRPSIARMIQNDSISNDLMKLAIETATGIQEHAKNEDELTYEEKIALYKSNLDQAYFLVAHCLVNPTWEDFAPVITDDQMMAIFSWAMATPQQMRSFRRLEKIPTNHTNGKKVQKDAKRDTGD